jgi:hypothetical protein
LNTSSGPSVSLTIDRYAQPFKPFNKKLSEIGLKSGDKIELWIKIVWREGQDDATPSTSDTYMALRLSYGGLDSVAALVAANRGDLTVARKEAFIQAMMWQATSKLTAVSRRVGA